MRSSLFDGPKLAPKCVPKLAMLQVVQLVDSSNLNAMELIGAIGSDRAEMSPGWFIRWSCNSLTLGQLLKRKNIPICVVLPKPLTHRRVTGTDIHTSRRYAMVGRLNQPLLLVARLRKMRLERFGFKMAHCPSCLSILRS